MSKKKCQAVIEVDDQTFACEKDLPHLVCRDGDTAFVGLGPIGIARLPRK